MLILMRVIGIVKEMSAMEFIIKDMMTILPEEKCILVPMFIPSIW